MKKALSLIDMELKIVKFRIQFPEMNKHHDRKDSIIRELDWDISQSDLIELATALHSAKIAFKNGKEANFIEILRFLESLFSKEEIKTPYDKKGKLSFRVSSTKFLDKLKKSFIDYSNSKL